MQVLDIIQRLAAAKTRVAKEHVVLDAYAANCVEFFDLMRMALDPFVTFGIKKVAAILEDDGAIGTLTLTDFLDLCERLSRRVLNGDAARQAIHTAAEQCDYATWNRLYRRVLLKDANVVDAAIINRVVDKVGVDASRFRIAVFHGQSASTAGGKPSGVRRLDVKVSGTRLFAVLDRHVVFHTDDGLVADEEALATELQQLCSRLPAAIVLDGVLTEAHEYVVFDLVPLYDFKSGLCQKTQAERRAALEAMQRSGAFSEMPSVRVLPQVEIDLSTAEGRQACDEFCRIALAHGFQTVMMKKSDAPYVGKKTTAWMERKASGLLTNA